MKYILSLVTFFLFQSAWAQLKDDWSSVYKITQEHPIYRAGETIQSPAGTFQLLMALHYIDREGRAQKDCVWYRVPQEKNLGVLKVIRRQTGCKDWLAPGDWEISEIRSFLFRREAEKLIFEYTNKEAKLKVEKFELLNLPQAQSFELFQSSAPKRRFPGVFFLAPQSEVKSLSLSTVPLKTQAECSFRDGTCQRCTDGVVKISDPDRPRFKCGVDRCGEKDELACVRGFEWKREREKPTCRLDPWHLYCQQGLRLECEGELGFCR